MDSSYEKRLMGSPYASPVKGNLASPLTSPSKEVYSDRYVPIRANSRWEQMDITVQMNSRLISPNSKMNRPETSNSGNNTVQQPSLNSSSSAPILAPPGIGYSYHYYHSSSLNEGIGDSPSSHTNSNMSNIFSNNQFPSEQQQQNDLYTSLVHNELFTSNISDYVDPAFQKTSSALSERENTNLFTFKLKKENPQKIQTSPYSLSPISDRSHRLLKQPRRIVRKIPKAPYKVLDAPELQDDFYLNLVDWSSSNILAVGLGACVYLWSAVTSHVTRLCEVTDSDSVTSVSWAEKGNQIAVGTHKGTVQIWDVNECRRLRQMDGHNARVGALAWNGDIIVSGSRDRTIRLRDVRILPSRPPIAGSSLTSGVTNSPGGCIITEHRQEVCGLKWSPDKQLLASGGNDNRLLVWSLAGGLNRPLLAYDQHIAAVKAIDWSPHQHGLLASGGGTADKCIRFWNTMTGQPLQCVDTGSQVCNIAWSKHSNELVSTHGYSQHQILLWRYPSLQQIAKLTGHTLRVLYLAMSPCGENIVTGAGDETLRFWNVFSKSKIAKPIRSSLGLFDGGIR